MMESSERNTPPTGEKKPYHAPELHAHGDLREITRGTGGANYVPSDSPDLYTS